MIAYWNKYLVCEIANKHYFTYFGKHPEDMVGLDMCTLLGTTSLAENMPYILEVLKGNSQTFEKNLVVKGHDNRTVLIKYTPHIENEIIEGFFSMVEDITYKKDSERIIHGSLWRYESILTAMRCSTWEWDIVNNTVVTNERWAELRGYTLDEIEAPITPETWIKTIHPPDIEYALTALNAHTSGETPYYNVEYRVKHKDGKLLWVLDRGKIATYTDDGKPALMFGTQMDISEQKENEARILQLAHYDPLTGLPNRILFMDRFDQAKNVCQRNGTMFALLFLDLDDFKKVNDSIGHSGGDLFLEEISSRLKACVRFTDTVCRYGGDEFTILLSEINTGEDARLVAEKICSEVTKTFIYRNTVISPTISIGISIYPTDGNTYEEILRDADLAMYAAKEKGKNAIHYFSNELDAISKYKSDIEAGLKRAMEEEEFEIHYQPQVDILTGNVTACEALLRWRTSTGLIPPDKFIPIAEESGQIIEIGEWVLKKVIQDINFIQESTGMNIKISVNVSAKQLVDPNFIDMVVSNLFESNAPRGSIELEITESMAMADIKKSIKVIRELSEIGVQFLIDDFGTGHSSLSYLKMLKPHYLKIDKSFVKDIMTDDDGAIIVEAIISLAHSLRLKVVAEGVETIEQFNFLKLMNCDLVQGYLLAKPMPIKNLTDYLKENS